ncbi:RnfH family protein [Chromatium okenii]|uniref:RnfH family protein n=1 Tax=Chromatium okenii TaxID=61644 RepID=UPI0026ECB16B|nr:RnfH family protein [Chromatium okenii]MBV5307971.1 RnfH family protein [Chromatium okenii]
MQIGVAYADKFKKTWLKLDVPSGSTVAEAIERSGLLAQFPDIDLTVNKVGIFGKITTLNAEISDGQRIEIYRPITADPKTAVRRDRGSDADD